jgi:unsaturated rhamnogalacturonyl hydrolase
MKRTARTFLLAWLAGLAAMGFVANSQPAAPATAYQVAAKSSIAPEWKQVPGILARIKAPVFPARQFPITDFGAAAGGNADCTEAIRKAIGACAQAGGGRVVVPAGEFLTGPIHLKSNVELHLASGATLKFKTDPRAYLPAVFTRFEGMECYNYSPLVYAHEQENVALTGEGLLDGQADDQNWWAWKGKKQGREGAPNQTDARQRLVKMVDQNVPVKERRFGEGSYLRPSFVEFYRCRNVLIEGVRIRRSPMWELHPTLCTNVIVRSVNILSHGPNNDGCDPESCRDVLIEGCVFDTGDDCIAIKSGRNNDGRRLGTPSENLIIRRCIMKDGHGGVVIGSEISGGCRNVFAEDCQMDSPNLDRMLRLKSNAVRGGVIENIFMRNVTVGQVADAVLQIDFLYEEGAEGRYKPAARNVVMENISVKRTPRVLNVVGFPGATITGVRIYDSTFTQVKRPDVVKEADVKLVDCAIGSQN